MCVTGPVNREKSFRISNAMQIYAFVVVKSHTVFFTFLAHL